MKSVKILGIDPGLNITGYGVIELNESGEGLLEGGIIRTNARHPMPQRLKEIYIELKRIMEHFKPEYVVVEELYVHYNHPKTAVIMGHARGMPLLAAGILNIPIVEYSATKIKNSLTGNGRASKSQVRRMVVARLNLSSEPEPSDVSDGLAAALCHASHFQRITV